MKRVSIFLVAAVIIILLSVTANAALIVRGTDTLGNQLIYDDDLNITWYDYTHVGGTWFSQYNWASSLMVDFGGTIYEDWRLPASGTCQGYSSFCSEMGHLYYTELRNSAGGPLSTSFTDGLTGNSESFHQLQRFYYWIDIGFDPTVGVAWYFRFDNGFQHYFDKYDPRYVCSGLAVRTGDVSVASVPEPATMLLFGAGIAGLGIMRKRMKG